MKKSLILLLAGLFVAIPVFSQSSEQLSQIIKTEKLTYALASYLPALQAQLITDEDSIGSFSDQSTSAFDVLKSKGVIAENASADSQITLAALSDLYLKTIGIKGGLFYTITKSPRYAFKELKARGILPQEADPSMSVSGREALDIFSDCLELTGGNE